eukprot:TRINITY_DN2781_c0_g1_i8.p1 TRINITY_DN2781_c0_g1~~TRINITY_DN2781_c0_g1_i8.p1  ORF type:complete len:640 (-),score=65.92 TRINITY_DN2781_c0_g1_i8:188-1945(-)
MTDMISGLIIGRIVDLYSNTRLLVLGLNIFQVGGGLLYCFSNSPPLLVLARLLSGCGKSISVAFLADLCKSTSKSKRTPVLLILNISYQIGLLLGPAMNLVLEPLHIHVTGHVTITKLNAPGLMMALIWTCVTLLVLVAYSDLVKLASEEVLHDQLDQGYLSSETMENIDLYYSDGSQSSQEDSSEDENYNHTSTDANIGGGQNSTRPNTRRLPLLLSPPPGGVGVPSTSNLLAIPAIDCFKARSRDGSGAEFSIGDGGSANNSSQGSGTGGTYGALADHLHSNEYQSVSSSVASGSRAPWDVRMDPTRLLRRSKRKSEKYIIAAERLIADESTYSEADTSYRTNASSRNISAIQSETESQSESVTWSDYRRQMARIEIVILILIRFIVLFCQTSLEAIVPPVMNTIFQFDDKANSYLYLAAAGEFIVVFGVLTAVSRCGVSDRSLVRTGLILSVLALIWHSCTIPRFTVGDRSQVKYFGIGAFLQLLGCPVVSEIGLALFSKLIPENVQGFAHGVRRFFSQLAVLLGPLWGASTLVMPLLMTLMPLGLQLLATVLFVIWYSRMLPASTNNMDMMSASENTPLLS